MLASICATHTLHLRCRRPVALLRNPNASGPFVSGHRVQVCTKRSFSVEEDGFLAKPSTFRTSGRSSEGSADDALCLVKPSIPMTYRQFRLVELDGHHDRAERDLAYQISP